MKNLLSENMLRFGTKNLSEAAQKELTLKSILETIDQYGLRKEVRRALNESMEPWQIVQAIRIAMKNNYLALDMTDERGIYKIVVGQINKANYPAVLAMVNKKGYKTICDWLSTEMEESYPNTFRSIFSGTNDQIVRGIERHLSQYNPNEDMAMASSSYGSERQDYHTDDRTGAETVRKIMGGGQ